MAVELSQIVEQTEESEHDKERVAELLVQNLSSTGCGTGSYNCSSEDFPRSLQRRNNNFQRIS